MENNASKLHDILAGVRAADRDAMRAAAEYQARLAKPPGSLGRLEELAVQLAGITGKTKNRLATKCLLVFCADNGVTEEGVASTPRSVTAAQTLNLAHGRTGAAVLAAQFGCAVRVCDVGVDAEIKDAAVLNKKIARGTQNIARGAAMSRGQAIEAMLCGAELALAAAQQGVSVLGVGEMGIGNTTTAAAVLAALTGESAESVTGRGAGLSDAAYQNKIAVVQSALAVNVPAPSDPIDVLSKVGGFDLAAMTGAFIGGARGRVPVVIDGFISAVAALCACRLCPPVRDYLIASHRSAENGCAIAEKELSLRPLLDLDMRLGEGSGCPIAMMLLDAACAVMNGMATFAAAGIDDGYLDLLDPARKAGEGAL
ncbi:MAG: nicotinate-nucleotide--dimethylbenzimidazole phosphoribosyltransferase [Clostridia bacterium]|nr:nicotinate-nucleotide--dimethylbenzimidazole phosphoribosyltransferase [Clostridia bacterium]